jgi:hypothetical protein
MAVALRDAGEGHCYGYMTVPPARRSICIAHFELFSACFSFLISLNSEE